MKLRSAYCKICGLTIKPGPAQSPLGELGVFIAQCVTKHYTIHVVDQLDGFTDYVFVNGFEIQRSGGIQPAAVRDQFIKNETSAWRGDTLLWRERRCITDEELREHYHRFLKLGIML